MAEPSSYRYRSRSAGACREWRILMDKDPKLITVVVDEARKRELLERFPQYAGRIEVAQTKEKTCKQQ